MTEILRLAARLNRSTEAIETEFGRSLDSITRFDAREWIKKLREEAAASTPPAKVHFGTWPGLKDDREAVYLAELRESNAALRVVLFNGQVFEGRISDFTPYTLTVEDGKGAGSVIVRKLAIAYYQQTGENAAASTDGAEAKDLAPFAGSGAPAFAGPSAAPATAQADVATHPPGPPPPNRAPPAPAKLLLPRQPTAAFRAAKAHLLLRTAQIVPPAGRPADESQRLCQVHAGDKGRRNSLGDRRCHRHPVQRVHLIEVKHRRMGEDDAVLAKLAGYFEVPLEALTGRRESYRKRLTGTLADGSAPATRWRSRSKAAKPSAAMCSGLAARPWRCCRRRRRKTGLS